MKTYSLQIIQCFHHNIFLIIFLVQIVYNMASRIVQHQDAIVAKLQADNVGTTSDLSLVGHHIFSLKDEVATLRDKNVGLKNQLDHSNNEVVRLHHELSAPNKDSIEANDRVSRLELEMKDVQNALKHREEMIISL